ncbi:CDP-4-dehydro-6-deoxy-D-glucose 3-epimerase [Roseobacter sp. SK209-2-6]|uniref:dTDP-4-dehydrorhamnose 3,5-epimerase family protein n=1 Tax=Roseobacter sp. SK209-2-6 TaxID=388739 RepID=UPI0000F3EB8A|nr:dTDP-4-dehydrorhamnose 3,5-epimerase family protein [Roseobacter sp. SK209-2-6]EBA14274.1 CDP-4-dehydro-6-deoxy-D-glucose 3-epimerase [Roseobacter sp. SK209-2-6]
MSGPSLTALPLPGVFHYQPQLHEDNRGSFGRLSCAKMLDEAGLNSTWVQSNLSRTATRGTLRGMHYQTPPFAEVKLLTCLSGQVYDVLVDLRPSSPSYLQWTSIVLEGARADTLYIPAGIAHGFQSLSDDVTLHYSHSQPFSPAYQAGISYRDPQIAIQWELPVTLLSERDAALPFLSDIKEAS